MKKIKHALYFDGGDETAAVGEPETPASPDNGSLASEPPVAEQPAEVPAGE